MEAPQVGAGSPRLVEGAQATRRPTLTRPLRRIGAIGAAVVAGALAAGWAAAAPAPAQAPSPPNIVVVMTDDQRATDTLGIPQVLAEVRDQGVEFANNYASDPNCCPSRATFLTGQYAHNHGVIGNTNARGYAALDKTNLLGSWLQDAGYLTGMHGKYLNPWSKQTPLEVPVGWDSFTGLQDQHHQMWDFDLNEDGTIVHYDPPVYKDNVLANRASGFIRKGLAADQPFFLWYTPPAPHAAGRGADRPEAGRCASWAQPSPGNNGAFAGEPLPSVPSFYEPDVSDKNPDIQALPEIRSPNQVERITTVRQCRNEALLSVDRDLDRFIDQIDAAGELDDSIIVFTSDNGFFYGEHRLPTGKLRPYEESAQVPLYIRGPGFTPGQRVLTPTVNPDLTATIVAAAGAAPGRVLDGLDLAGLAASQPNLNRTVLLEMPNHNDAEDESGSGPRYSVAVSKRWEVIDYYDIGFTEVYDLQLDPYQLDGTVSAIEAPHVAGMTSRLNRLRDCAGAACHVAPGGGRAATRRQRLHPRQAEAKRK